VILKCIADTPEAKENGKETVTYCPEIKVPVLIMVGNEDKITPPAAARFMHEKLKVRSWKTLIMQVT
jgi:pimeloyl-ACP methyl ester carboxylesterase